MSAYSGRQSKGATRRLREVKRAEAEERNARTDPADRRSAREGSPESRRSNTPK